MTWPLIPCEGVRFQAAPILQGSPGQIMTPPPPPFLPFAPRRFGALLCLALLVGSPVVAMPAAQTGRARPPAPAADPFEARRLVYLETELRQLRKVPKQSLGPMRLGAGVVASAALSVEAGRSTRDDAARWARATLEACGPRSFSGLCERALIPLQRTLLQYPDVLPARLRARIRAAAVATAPPPSGAARTDPWGFRETENGKLLIAARSLVAQVVAGTPDSPAAAAWGEFLTAFLTAREQRGWYEGQSPGYLGLSITFLLHIADHAPDPALRALASRQLDVLFADWAQEQVAGFPAGVQSRAYPHWALGTDLTPWRAWAWLVGGTGGVARRTGRGGAPAPPAPDITFLDWPDLAVSRYRVPAPVARLLAGRREQPAYEIRARRTIDLGSRRDLDAALYSYATPDYILGSSQAVEGLRFGVSGGQEVQAALLAECAPFAPLYLWSRIDHPRKERWRGFAGQDLTFGQRSVVLARLGLASAKGEGGGVGHAYLSPPWSRPEAAGAALVSRCGDTYVALVTVGGWEVVPAPRRFPDLYEGRDLAKAWVAVPRRQPAEIALEVGRRAEHGTFSSWTERAARLTLAVSGEGELRYTALDGTPYAFRPGEQGRVGEKILAARDFPLHSGPFLAATAAGTWTFSPAEGR
jgi:hypothetical protein